MRKILSALALWVILLSPALAANVNIDGLPAAGSVGGTDLLECEQGGTNRKCTAAQTAAYVYSLMSGDATAAAGGAVTFATVNANVGTFGSATNCVTLTVNAKGLITAASQVACTVPAGANPTGTAGPTAVNGVATTFMRSDGAPAVQQGSAAQKGIVQVDGTTITASSGVISTVPLTATPSVQSGTNYAFQASDLSNVVYLSNASPQAPTIPQAGTGSFTTGRYGTACNIGAGAQTITPTTSTIGGASTYILPAGSAASPKCISFISDGTNYVIVPDYFRTGAGVETAAAIALSGAGGITSTIAAGTSALGTSAIGSAACATVVTTAATNTATTDVVMASFNSDPTAVTGYTASASGMLTIIGYPTSGNVNFKVCNNTAGSITPGAITLNWRVVR